MTKPFNFSANPGNPALGWMTFLSVMLISVAATAGQSVNNIDDPLKNIEISGISLAMPLDKITGILTAQGYTAVNSRLFTKQGELQNNRRTVFRIEIEDNADSRQITYYRSLSGGRVKTAGGDRPIPEYEVDIAQQFYQLMCENILENVMKERQCEPRTEYNITAGNGRFIQINDRYSMQLNATAVNSAIGIRYTY